MGIQVVVCGGVRCVWVVRLRIEGNEGREYCWKH